MQINFELSARDIDYFRERLNSARDKAGPMADETAIIAAARALVSEAAATNPPDFVMARLTKLNPLIAMLEDQDWRLQGEDRARVIDALAYFVEPDDLIPDKIPGIGYLDDAIMIELVIQELEPELTAYEEFSIFREGDEDAGGASPADLETMRDALQGLMRRRVRRQERYRRLGLRRR